MKEITGHSSIIWSDIAISRPGMADFRLGKVNFRLKRADLRLDLRPGGWDGTEDVKNCPDWNHRSSAPPGPLPQKRKETIPFSIHKISYKKNNQGLLMF